MRTQKRSVIYTNTFTSDATNGVISIFNGGIMDPHRITSASVYLNNVLILGPDDFKNMTTLLEKNVSMSNTNQLRVELGSKPNTWMMLTISCKACRPEVSISAAPQDIVEGVSSTLSWTSQNAASCSIEPGIGQVPTNGSIAVTPTATTAYTITATGLGQTARAQTTVTVHPPPTASLSVSPGTIVNSLSTATLSWSTSNACTVDIEPGVGQVAASGFMTVSPPETKEYRITATGHGATATANATLTVHHVPTASLSASPDSISQDQSSLLDWSTTDAYSVSIEPGIGPVESSGSLAVSPAATTTYTLTAIGSGGTATATATVTLQFLRPPQPENSFGAFYEDLIPPDSTAAFEPRRFAVVTGLVKDSSGAPIPGVSISLLGLPQYGSAVTGDGGRFEIPTEGGDFNTVVYEKEGFLTIHRKVDVPWGNVAIAPDVAMIQADTASTNVDMGSAEVTVHRSIPITDADGMRACTLVFPPGNRAWEQDENGQVLRELTELTVRATEYQTPESMPGELPANVAFTYCVELSADNVAQVAFDHPITVYVNDFLGFSVGTTVPVGWYDRSNSGGSWVPSDNGVVVMLLDTNSDGVVDSLDSTGDGLPDDLNHDGSFSDEVAGLSDPIIYPPGATFMRFGVTHFTPWDANFPVKAPDDAKIPEFATLGMENPTDSGKQPDDPCNTGSYSTPRSRVLNEDIPIPGTDIDLHYSSSRVEGHKTVVRVPLGDGSLPSSLVRILLRMEVAGRALEEEYPAQSDQVGEISWDGLDVLGRMVSGSAEARVRVGYVYPATYASPAEFERAFGQYGSQDASIATRQELVLWKNSTVNIPAPIDVMGNGWTVSSHHTYSPMDPTTLYRGDGTIIQADTDWIETVAGNGNWGYSGDDGPATSATIGYVEALLYDGEGNLYLADSDIGVVRKVDKDGIITTIAGNGDWGYSGDGGPATLSRLANVCGLAMDSKGNLYVSDSSYHTVRKIDTNGIITTVAGKNNGSPTLNRGYSGDGGPATLARLYSPRGLAVDPEGNLYIADYNNYVIRKVDPNGIISTIAGKHTSQFFSGDGGPAKNAGMNPIDVALDREGNLYIVDRRNHRIRKINKSGIITTVAGNGSYYQESNEDGGPAILSGVGYPGAVELDSLGNIYIVQEDHHVVRKVNPQGIISPFAGEYSESYGGEGFSGDGGPPGKASLVWPLSVAAGPDGRIYISDSGNYRIRRVNPISAPNPDLLPLEKIFPDQNGLGYIISAEGIHIRTIDLRTGKTLNTFGYDAENRLVSVTDRFGAQTLIQRDSNGNPTAIVNPDGVTTELAVDPDGNLTSITNPSGDEYQFEYGSGGLLTAKIEPNGNRFTHVFDSDGRLTETHDEEGGSFQFTHSMDSAGNITHHVSTAEGYFKNYVDTTLPSGDLQSVVTDVTGGQATTILSVDGLTESKSLSCGTEIRNVYGLDSWHRFRRLNQTTQSMPSGLAETTVLSTTYEDTDLDGVPDRVLDTISVNEKASTLENLTLSGEKTLTTPENRSVKTYYDPATLLASRVSVPGLLDVDYGYDARGRLTSIFTGTRNTSFAYDDKGFLGSVTDSMSRTTGYTYDPNGQVTGISRPDGTSLSFSYDANGNMTVLTNPRSIDHGFGYNKTNLNTSYTTPISGSYTYLYDSDKHLMATMFPSGKGIYNLYDKTRLSQIQTPEGDIDYTYYCSSKVESITKGSESIHYAYDGSLLTQDARTGALNQTLSYTYNNDFNLTSFTYAGNTQSYTYDRDGLLTGAGNFTITRDPGNALPISVNNGTLNVSRTFNGYGEISGQDSTVGGQDAFSWNVDRDDNGRITRKTEVSDGAAATYDYTFDNMGRLLTVTKDGVLVEEYRYNENGSRIYEMNALKGVSSQTYTYTDEDHCISAGDTNYEYDLDGFLTQKTVGSDVTQYHYSSRGELLRVDLPGGKVIEYENDPLGRRIAKKVNGVVVEKYLWQGMTRLLAVYDGSDNLLMRFVYADGRMPVAMEREGATYYLAYDQVGSLKTVTDGSGNPVKVVEYDSFGNVISDTNPTFAVLFGFAGGMLDSDTRLVRFGYRDYDSEIGRWTTKDPILFDGGQLDLFGYIANDPVNLIDQLGLDPGWVFPTMDAAGRDAIYYYNPQSIKEATEYGGYIFKNPDGTYSYGEARKGTNDEVYLPWWQHLKGDVCGDYHTHGANDDPNIDPEEFSDEDKSRFFWDKDPSYLGTPSGHIKLYDPAKKNDPVTHGVTTLK